MALEQKQGRFSDDPRPCECCRETAAAAYLVLRFAAVLGAARPAGFAVLAAGLAGFFALAAVFAMILSKGSGTPWRSVPVHRSVTKP
jgi:hypothetical protein